MVESECAFAVRIQDHFDAEQTGQQGGYRGDQWRPANIDMGDLMVGDLDGVIVVPRKVEDEVIRLAVEKATGEKVVRKAIEAGMSSTEAFRKYGIL